MNAKLLAFTLTAALVLAGGAGLTSGFQPGAAVPGGKGAAITIRTFQFRPSVIEVKTGTEVTWTNTDEIEHIVASGAPDSRDGRFTAPLAGKGATFSFTFTQPGTYPYFCDRHHSMRGEIRVN